MASLLLDNYYENTKTMPFINLTAVHAVRAQNELRTMAWFQVFPAPGLDCSQESGRFCSSPAIQN